MSMLDHALQYASRGWAVFPTTKQKTPITPRGFHDASTKPHIIQRWWKQYPNANIGIATGPVSGIAVLDLDLHKEGSSGLLEDLQELKGPLENTLIARTGGGGLHYYFKYPDDNEVTNATDFMGLRGLDIRGEGGYVVAPPSTHASGADYSWETPLDTELAECPEFMYVSTRRLHINFNDTTSDIPDGQRNIAMTAVAGLARSFGLTEEEIFKIVYQQNQSRCTPPLSDSEIRTIVNHIMKYPPFNTRSNASANIAEDALLSVERTDVGYSELISLTHPGKIKFNHTKGGWLLWDRHYWKADDTEKVVQYAIQAARMYAGACSNIQDDEARMSAAKHASRLQSKRAIDAGLALLRTHPAISTNHSAWDQNKDALVCASGVIDLRTGDLFPGHPEDLNSQASDVFYVPEAECPIWLKFLDDVFMGDVELIEFIQKAVGYSLTGRTDEQCLFLLIGTGSNGKTTLLEVLHALLGTFAHTAPFATFQRSFTQTMSNDLAALAGKRFVSASEPNAGATLDESRIKTITGGDPITARFLHKEFFTFHPVCTLWLGVNHLPRVKDDSEGFWRRVRRVNFKVKFADSVQNPTSTLKPKDKALLAKLMDELPGILAWAVEGSKKWYANGLSTPAAVMKATAQYQQDSDPLHNFLQLRCEEIEGAHVPEDSLYRAYVDDCMQRHLRKYEILAGTRFHERMRVQYTRRVVQGRQSYSGLKLKTTSAKSGKLSRDVKRVSIKL